MNPKFHGDTYEFAKRAIISGLAPFEEWAIHPMYYDVPPEEEYDPQFVGHYADFLRIRLIEGGECLRNELVEVVSHCRQHLFIDPDTGLWRGQRPPRGGWNKHIGITELADIANSPERRNSLTLVFDQSYPRVVMDLRERVEEKLGLLGNHLYGAAYVSHVAFIWVSHDEVVVNQASQRLLAQCRFPRHRFLRIR